MLINGIDISIYGGIQLQTDIQNSKRYSKYELLINGDKPILLGKEEKLKIIKVEILFKGESRDQILDNISNLVSKLDGIVDLKLEGYSKNYKVILINDVIQKKKSKRKYKLLLEFEGFSVMDEVIEVMDRVTNKTINVLGNKVTEAIVEITPTNEISDITLEGLADDPIIIKKLKANKTVVVDGELQKVTVDGVNKYGDTDMWDFPRLIPGENNIQVSRNNCNITIKYKPRFI